jgi:hypothetical protein
MKTPILGSFTEGNEANEESGEQELCFLRYLL